MLSGIMKRVDKVRETLKNFTTMLNQVKQIIHNKTTTLSTLENDVSQWWMHIESTDAQKFKAIQKLKQMSDERSILSAASELTSIVNAGTDIERSIRRWGRLVKLENYSRESLRAKVIDWTKRWIEKWHTLNEAYKSLRGELLASSRNYVKIYESRTEADAILDNAESALNAASSYSQKNVMDTPPPMSRSSCCPPGQPCSHKQQQFVEPVKPAPQSVPVFSQSQPPPQPQKKKRRKRPRPKTAAPMAQQPQPQQGGMQGGGGFDMSNVPPELMQQLMQYQQQAPAAAPSSPVKPAKNKVPKYSMMQPMSSIPFSASDWGS